MGAEEKLKEGNLLEETEGFKGNRKDNANRGEDRQRSAGEKDPFQGGFNLAPGIQLRADPDPAQKAGQHRNGNNQNRHVEPTLSTQRLQPFGRLGNRSLDKSRRQGATGHVADFAEQQTGLPCPFRHQVWWQGADHQQLNDFTLKCRPQRQHNQCRNAAPERSTGTVIERQGFEMPDTTHRHGQ